MFTRHISVYSAQTADALALSALSSIKFLSPAFQLSHLCWKAIANDTAKQFYAQIWNALSNEVAQQFYRQVGQSITVLAQAAYQMLILAIATVTRALMQLIQFAAVVLDQWVISHNAPVIGLLPAAVDPMPAPVTDPIVPTPDTAVAQMPTALNECFAPAPVPMHHAFQVMLHTLVTTEPQSDRTLDTIPDNDTSDRPESVVVNAPETAIVPVLPEAAKVRKSRGTRTPKSDTPTPRKVRKAKV